MIRGWDTALQSMTVGEKATVLITDPERFGYGVEGIPGFVPPNAQLEMEIELLGAEDGADLSTLATSDPLKPVRCIIVRSEHDIYIWRRPLKSIFCQMYC